MLFLGLHNDAFINFQRFYSVEWDMMGAFMNCEVEKMWEEYVEACFKILSRHLHLEIEGEKSLIRDILPDISPSPTHTLDSALCFRSSCQLLYPSSLSSYHRGKIEIPLCGRRHLNCVFLPSPLPGGRTETSIVKDHTWRLKPQAVY